MSGTLFLVTWIIVGMSNCFSQSSKDSAAKAETILKIEGELLNALATGDTNVWNHYLDDSFIIITEDGSRNSKRELVSSIRPLPKGYSGHIDVAELRIGFIGNVAVVNYVADEVEFVYGQKLHTTYAVMNVYSGSGSGWSLMASQIFEIPQNPSASQVAADILKGYTGIYELSEGITYTVTLENNTLYGQKTGRQKEKLFSETDDVFFRKNDTRGRKIFVKNDQGKFLMIERRNGNDVVWKPVNTMSEK